jgi:hypothetical protein
VHEQPAGRGAEVDGLPEADHDTAAGCQLVEEYQEITQGPAQAVQAEDVTVQGW